MNHVTHTRKRPVNLSLDAELVREARLLTPNLSETVETLLAAYVAEERTRRAEQQRGIDTAIRFLNEQYDRHGGIGEEFSPF